jgi:hypothetical protein
VQAVLADIAGVIHVEKQAVEGLIHAVGVLKNAQTHISALMGLYASFEKLVMTTAEFAAGAIAFMRPPPEKCHKNCDSQ